MTRRLTTDKSSNWATGKKVAAFLLLTAALAFMAWLTFRNWGVCRETHDFWYCFQALG